MFPLYCSREATDIFSHTGNIRHHNFLNNPKSKVGRSIDNDDSRIEIDSVDRRLLWNCRFKVSCFASKEFEQRGKLVFRYFWKI